MIATGVVRCVIALSLCLGIISTSIPLALGQSEGVPQTLQIVILEGEGALNNVKQRTAREQIVQVQDENHRPVAGVLVTFVLPEYGPSGTFLNGGRSFAATTDEAGRVVAPGFKPNAELGEFRIQVTADFRGRSAKAQIRQSNVRPSTPEVPIAHSAVFKWGIIGAVATAGVVAGVLVATRGNGQGTTITSGTGTVGPP
jgi:hypothetical protein